MSDDVELEFITRLGDFGLNDKEARLYYHLLRYGAKPPAIIARHMHTYREDVHRTLNALLEKGIVVKSLSTPTVYVAVPPETALEAVFVEHKLEQQKRATLKRELVELAAAMGRAPPEPADGCSYRVLSGPNELNTLSIELLQGLPLNLNALCRGPFYLYSIGLVFLIWRLTARRGVRMRVLTDISRPTLNQCAMPLSAAWSCATLSRRGVAVCRP